MTTDDVLLTVSPPPFLGQVMEKPLGLCWIPKVLEGGLVQICPFIKKTSALQSLGYNLGVAHITAVPEPASWSSAVKQQGKLRHGQAGADTDPAPSPGLFQDVCGTDVLSQDK